MGGCGEGEEGGNEHEQIQSQISKQNQKTTNNQKHSQRMEELARDAANRPLPQCDVFSDGLESPIKGCHSWLVAMGWFPSEPFSQPKVEDNALRSYPSRDAWQHPP